MASRSRTARHFYLDGQRERERERERESEREGAAQSREGRISHFPLCLVASLEGPKLLPTAVTANFTIARDCATAVWHRCEKKMNFQIISTSVCRM
jgi:hypothetical protein